MKVSLWRLGGLTAGILTGLYLLRRHYNSRSEISSSAGPPRPDLDRDSTNRSEWFKDGTLSSVHHELRNNLNLLTNYSEMMQNNSELGKKTLVVSKKLTNTIDSFITCLRLENRSYQPEPEEVPLRSFVDQRITCYRPLFEFLERDLTVTYEDPPEVIDVDRRYFEVILDSLLVECTEPPGGSTRLIVSGTDEHSKAKLQLDVRDLDRDWESKKLEELKQSLNGGSPRSMVKHFSPGTGLRLMVAQQLLRRHGGRLKPAINQSDGVTFRCYL